MNKETMEDRLRQAFPGCTLEVIDLTGTEDHWEVRIAADELKPLTRVRKHQAVMKVFAAELQSGEVHALAIKTIDL